jgi:y4mF family transcriptional regulator
MEINSAEDLGSMIRRNRQNQGLTQAQLAGASGVGLRFIVDLEKGKPTCELGKALKVTLMLGIKFSAQEPPL